MFKPHNNVINAPVEIQEELVNLPTPEGGGLLNDSCSYTTWYTNG